MKLQLFILSLPLLVINQNLYAQTTPNPTAQKVAVVTKEKYELLQNPEDIGLTVIPDAITQTGTAGIPSSFDIEGTIKQVFVGSKEIALLTHDIVHDHNKAWISTKNYGKIGISSGDGSEDSTGGIYLWLTPSQKAMLKKLYTKSK